VNASLANRTCVLGIAVELGDESICNLLLAAGARTDGHMPDGEKILPWVIRRGRLDLVRAMMKADSDPHLKDRSGNPLLHIAMESGRRDLMETLIELGADPAATNAAGETTIQLALRQGWFAIVPRLAAAGADPNMPGRDGFTLLEEAVAAGDPVQTAFFLKIGADPNHRGRVEETVTPLEKVFGRPGPELFEVFLKHGAKPAAGGWDPWLWRAFHKRDLAKARLLLAHGARADRTGPHSELLLETAASAGEAAFVKLLLDYGAPAGRALYAAAACGDHPIVSLLLAGGASPDFTRFPGRDSALAAAIRGRHDRVAELLVVAGADARPILPEGQSAFHLAVATGCHRTVRQLLDRGADPDAPFLLPVSNEFLRMVRPGVMRWVLKMDRNATPLMVAADSGNIQTARYLKRAGARTNVRTKSSALWPINFASRRGDVKMMRLFLGKDPFREERRIEVRLSEQRARVFDMEGNELFATKVSTGRRGFATPTGEFVITNKHRDWTSTLYHASMPYFQRFSCGDFGMHQGNVPGYPASHGCIRVPAGNAAKLFAMTQTGDRVRILP
jgi:ankyrin repeat protein